MSEESLIATIEGRFTPTPAVELGKAFGLVLETPDAYRAEGGYRCNGYSFDDATMQPALVLMDRRGIYEAKAVKRYGACDVVAKADQLVGSHLYEHKTTSGTFDFDKYADSYQWRFMVDIFEARVVTYHVFLLDDHGNGVVTLKGVESFNLFPYAGLHADCCALLDRFVEYVERKGLAEGLRQRQALAA